MTRDFSCSHDGLTRRGESVFRPAAVSQRPLGLPHLRRMCVPVNFERHQYVLIRVHVPKFQI